MECIDISKNCRACQIKTQEESQRILIFNTVKLPDIYKETTSLDIHETDRLPKVLCSTCYDRLLEAYNFRKMCSAAVLHFQKILSMDVPEEKYNLLENLTDAHIMHTSHIKTESDSDASNFSIRDQNCPLDRDESLNNISDTLSIDDRLPEILKLDPDIDTPLISRKAQKKLECAPKKMRKTNPSPGTQPSCSLTLPDDPEEAQVSITIEALRKHFQCQKTIVHKDGSAQLLEKGAQKTFITDTERRAIVAIIVDHLKTTRRDIITHHDKSLYAKAAVKMFPVLGNNTGIGEVQDSFYNKRNYTGYITNRLKGLQRDVKKRKRAFGEDLDEKSDRKSSKKQSIVSTAKGSNNNFNVKALSSIKADLELMNPTSDREEIIRKTLETRELRDASEPNDDPIWIQYPRFRDTLGLIQCDFEDRFPEANPKLKKFFIEKREKIFEVYEQSTKKLTDSMKEWHEDVKSLACLLVLSGTTPSGNKGISRISEERALDEIIGLLPPDSIPPKVADKPKILAQGSSKKEVYRFYLNVGTFLIETQNTFIDALDLYFKSFHVFKIEPLPPLKNLFDFIDQIVLGISEKENCSSNVAFLNNLLNI